MGGFVLLSSAVWLAVTCLIFGYGALQSKADFPDGWLVALTESAMRSIILIMATVFLFWLILWLLPYLPA